MYEFFSEASLKDALPEVFNRSFYGIITFAPLRNSSGEIIDFTYKFMNDTSLNFIGGTKEDYLGKRYLKKFPKAYDLGIFGLYKKVAETGAPEEDDFYYKDEKIDAWFRNSAFRSDLGDYIVVYFRDISDKKNLEIWLKNSLQEKEFLLKEIHHRVKNSLQMISSIFSIQSMALENPEMENIIAETQNRIKAVALIHQKLYEAGESFQRINLQSYIRDLVSSVNNKERIKIRCSIHNAEVHSRKACSLV